MKSKTLMCITPVILFAVLALPARLTAQTSGEQRGHHRYKLIDIGLGGPQSAVFEFAHTLTRQGLRP